MRTTHRIAKAWNTATAKSRKIVSATVLATFVLSATQIHTAFAAVVPLNKTQFSSKGFILSGTFTNAGNIQQGAGSFANGSVKAYPEGSCVPSLITVKNNSNAAGDIVVSPVYDYMDNVIGLNDLQTLTTSLAGSAIGSADDLNDFGTTGSSLSAATSFTTTANGSVSATVTGPYSGNNDGVAATTASDAFRHYNVTLSNVAAGATVNLLFCGRLGVDASEYNGASLSIRTVQGGQENIAIQVNQLLALPSLTLTKVVASGDALPEEFSFTVSPSINNQSSYSIPAGQDTVIIDNVMPDGSYTITETGPSGYSFLSGTGTSCTFNQSGAASATLAAGKPATNASCTYTNEEVHVPQATLTVTKVVINNDAGTSQVSDFPLSVGQTAVTSGAANSFTPGTYAVTESNASGYVAAYSGDCDSQGNVTLADGDSKTCTITNDDVHVPEATLTVTKVVVNDDTGASQISDFPLFVGNTSVTSGQTATFAPGTYAVTESTQGGYTATYSGDCDSQGNVTLADGDSKSCTITNNDITPPPPPEDPTAILTVTKVVVNDDNGEASVSSFPLFVGNTSVTSGAANIFAPGTYTVTESNQGGYTATYSGDCDSQGNVTLAADDNKTCTITNDDVHVPEATLTVVKVVVNNDNGTSQVSDFPLFVGETSVTSGQANTLAPGTYSVSETNQNGYTATFSGDCDSNGNITLADADDKTCTITNDDITPPPAPNATLTVIKVVVNNDNGTSQVSDFPLSVGQTAVTSGAANSFAPGTYAVTETNATGYTATYSGDCDSNGNITLADADNKTCTITNDDITPPPPEEEPSATLTVIKVVVNDNSGESSVASFPLFVGETSVTSGAANSFAPGTYLVSETNQGGYTAAFSGDCDSQGSVTLANGDSKTCTITNDDIAPPPPPGGGGGGSTPQPTITVVTVVINDDGGTLLPAGVLMTVGDGSVVSSTFGGSVNPGMTVSLPSGAYVVDGSVKPGYSRTASTTCTGNITLGQNVVCTVTYDDLPPTAPPAPPAPVPPPPAVLGATDEQPEAPAPQVLGATDELPRTGTPLHFLLAPFAALFVALRRNKR